MGIILYNFICSFGITNTTFLSNNIAKLVALEKKKFHNLFIFSSTVKFLGKWYRKGTFTPLFGTKHKANELKSEATQN